jgi:hypothetical protein
MVSAHDSLPLKLAQQEVVRRRARVLGLVEKLPEATTAKFGRHLSLEVRGRRFAWYLEDHHGDGRLALNCKAPPGAQKLLAKTAPQLFHIPKHVGRLGWVGLWLDLADIDWSVAEAVLAEAYRMAAPKSLLARLESS